MSWHNKNMIWQQAYTAIKIQLTSLSFSKRQVTLLTILVLTIQFVLTWVTLAGKSLFCRLLHIKWTVVAHSFLGYRSFIENQRSRYKSVIWSSNHHKELKFKMEQLTYLVLQNQWLKMYRHTLSNFLERSVLLFLLKPHSQNEVGSCVGQPTPAKPYLEHGAERLPPRSPLCSWRAARTTPTPVATGRSASINESTIWGRRNIGSSVTGNGGSSQVGCLRLTGFEWQCE